MNPVFTFALWVAFGFAAIVGAFPYNDTRNFNDTNIYGLQNMSMQAFEESPWFHHNGHALIETWIGREAVNVGDLTGAKLYEGVWSKLDYICPGTKPGYCYDTTKYGLDTHEVTKLQPWPVQIGPTKLFIQVENFRWRFEEVRRLLIGAVAGALEAMTRNPFASPNCYAVALYGTHFCNIGNSIRINLPDLDQHNNFIHVRFYGGWVYNYFRCCIDDKVLDKNTRRDVDEAMDGLARELELEFQQGYSRLTNCVLHEWRICEECGEPCEGCQTSCPHS